MQAVEQVTAPRHHGRVRRGLAGTLNAEFLLRAMFATPSMIESALAYRRWMFPKATQPCPCGYHGDP